MNELHVVYTRLDLSDNYTPIMAASMKSVIDNTSQIVHFHIITNSSLIPKNPDKIPEVKEKLKTFVINEKCTIEFHHVSTHDNMRTNPAYLRLYLPEILPSIDIVVVLGGDVIVKTDLMKLINNIPNTYSLAAATDYGIIDKYLSSKTVRKFYKHHKVDLAEYVCSDVLIYFLNNIRFNKKIPYEAIKFHSRYGDKIPLYEQDILNIVFNGDKYILPQRFNLPPVKIESNKLWNILSEKINDVDIPGYIIHFEGAIKPWNQYHSEFDRDFWNYLFLTPWGTKDEIINLLKNLLPL